MGQKGTIGIKLRQADMPFTKEGITPDLIVSPNAFPKRMTIAQLIECVFGKACALKGVTGDGTPFTKPDMENIRKELEAHGYRNDGTEYMYNGMTGKKMATTIFVGPTYYQRLKHLVSDKIHCCLPDHEVLTNNGWKLIPDVTLEDKVACLVNNKLVYEHPTKLHHYKNYKGKMYHIENQQIDLDVTANHRMYVSKQYGRRREWLDYDFEKAEDIISKHRKYKKDAIWHDNDYQFVLPAYKEYDELEVDMHPWLIMFGIWLAEGCANDRVAIAQNKQRVKDELHPALDKLGFNYSVYSNGEHQDTLFMYNKQLTNYLKQYSVGSLNKYLPDWVWKLSRTQCKTLMHGMWLGDGSTAKVSGNIFYYTASKRLADDFMRLCLHAGYSANRTVHIKEGTINYIRGKPVVNNHDVYRLGIIRSKNSPSVNHGHTHQQKVQHEYMYDYNGPVYCLSVPGEVFYVRRSGKPVWTGNSRARGPKTRLTRQPPEGR